MLSHFFLQRFVAVSPSIAFAFLFDQREGLGFDLAMLGSPALGFHSLSSGLEYGNLQIAPLLVREVLHYLSAGSEAAGISKIPNRLRSSS